MTNNLLYLLLYLIYFLLPINVPKQKYMNGIPTIGEAIFTNQLGTKGVNLKNSIYQKRLDLFALI